MKFRRATDGALLAECPTLRGLNVLGHAQLLELHLGSECGGHGICGKDRVLVLEEERVHYSPPTAVERKHLSDAELARGVRLACQCFPRSDGEDCSILVLERAADRTRAL